MLPVGGRQGRAPVHTFFCIDGHTCGNPVRLVAGGAPLLNGATMSARRQDFLQRFDWIRTALMFEPRGHDIMSGAILYPPCRDDCDTGILYIEVTGCLPMCGHGTIGSVTFALEQGLVTPRSEGTLRLDTPAGLVVADYEREGRFVERVRPLELTYGILVASGCSQCGAQILANHAEVACACGQVVTLS